MVQSRQFQQQILDVQQADELLAIAVVHRIAAELVATEHRQDFLERRVELERHQVFTGVGPVDHLQLAHFHGGSQHTHALVARVLATAGVQDQFQFFTAVMVFVMRAGFTLAGDPQDGVGAGVEQVDRRVHGPVEQVQRHCGPERQQLGFANGPGFRGQLTDHNVQVRDDEERSEERYAFDHFGRLHADGFKQRLQNVCERRFTDPAQAQGGEGDTQLAR